jgi:membrane associated rhomboid family serine protease
MAWLTWLIWFGIYPFASEAFGVRKPWVVRAIGAVTIFVSLAFMVQFFTEENHADLLNLMLWTGKTTSSMALPVGFHGYQLITHAFLHGGLLHLAGNMLFLFVLGSRVNALIGNVLTLMLYPLLAMIAGITHMVATANDDLSPMLGASGAVMDLAGMYLVFFPAHNVHMVAWYRWGLLAGLQLSTKTWAMRGFWVVLFYIAFDVLYTCLGLKDGVAHWAHLGGFIAGVLIALMLMAARLVNARGGDLLTVVFGRFAWQIIGKPNRPGITLP